MAADPNARMGIEFEFQSLHIVFAQTTGQPFPTSVNFPGFPTENKPFCLPLTRQDYFLPGQNQIVNWNGDWGFRVVQDSPAPKVLNGVNTWTSVLEINTSAKLITDFTFWITARLAAKAFDETARELENSTAPSAIPGDLGDRWILLSTFLEKYNARIEGLDLDATYNKNRFKLDLNPAQERFAQGMVNGAKYFPYVKISGNDNRDVQLSYSVELGWMDGNMDRWVAMWSSLWFRYPRPDLQAISDIDPDIGVKESAKDVEVYRNQILAALWRQAHAQSRTIVPNAMIADANQRALVRGLVTYLLAAGAVTLIPNQPLLKNEFSQLPKTSPASIGHLIVQMYPALAPTLANIGNLATAQNAYQFIQNTMRNLVTLQANGMLVNAAPAPAGTIPGLAPGVTYTGAGVAQNLVGGADPGHFTDLWQVSLDYTGALAANAAAVTLTDANKQGYVNVAPFYCNWSGQPQDVKTSFPAVQDGANGIRIVFESRYHNNLANVGFSPRVLNCITRRTYFKLRETFTPGPPPQNVLDAFDRYFAEDASVRQKIQLGNDGAGHPRPQYYH